MSANDVRNYGRKANPDDPNVRRPPRGPHGPMPGPNFLGLEGRIAIVQGQVFLLAVILVAQLAIITDALYELLSGRSERLGWLALGGRSTVWTRSGTRSCVREKKILERN